MTKTTTKTCVACETTKVRAKIDNPSPMCRECRRAEDARKQREELPVELTFAELVMLDAIKAGCVTLRSMRETTALHPYVATRRLLMRGLIAQHDDRTYFVVKAVRA